MTDADQHDPNGKKADANEEHFEGEPPETGQHESFGLKQDAALKPAGAGGDVLSQPIGGEMEDGDQERPVGARLGAEQLDYLTKLDAEHNDSLAKLEATRQSRPEPIAEERAAATGPPSRAEAPQTVKPLPPTEPPLLADPPPPVEPPRPASNAALTMVVIGIIAGILFGGVVAAITWHQTKATPPPELAAPPGPSLSQEPRDLASVDSSTVGLSGHLTTKWDGNLNYNFVITPDDPARKAQFALMISDPPRPLSMSLELKNSYGFILCSREIVLKYDAGKAAAGAAPHAPAPSDADEVAREKDKDVFQNQTGPDGKIVSISSQGKIPCPAEAYANFAYWSFTPEFPDIAEQDQLQEKADTPHPASPRRAFRKRAKRAKKVK